MFKISINTSRSELGKSCEACSSLIRHSYSLTVSTLFKPVFALSNFFDRYLLIHVRSVLCNCAILTSDAIKPLALFRLTVKSWRLIFIQLRRRKISLQVVTITAVSSSSILRKNPSAWFFVFDFCSLSAARSFRTSLMLSHPSSSTITTSALFHKLVPGKPLNVNVQQFCRCSQKYSMLIQTEKHIMH